MTHFTLEESVSEYGHKSISSISEDHLPGRGHFTERRPENRNMRQHMRIERTSPLNEAFLYLPD